MDITPIVIALIFAGVFVWYVFRQEKPSESAEIEKLARSAVALAQDKKLCQIIPSGQDALNFAAAWIVEAAHARGYEINISQATDAARVAYQMLFKAGK